MLGNILFYLFFCVCMYWKNSMFSICLRLKRNDNFCEKPVQTLRSKSFSSCAQKYAVEQKLNLDLEIIPSQPNVCFEIEAS